MGPFFANQPMEGRKLGRSIGLTLTSEGEQNEPQRPLALINGKTHFSAAPLASERRQRSGSA